MVTQAQAKTAVDEVSKNSSTSVDAVINMFSSNKLAGNTPQARLEIVLAGTNSGPFGQQFRGNYSDTGFPSQFQDGQDQAGHFLTAVGIGYRSDKDDFDISMMVGHELFPDFGKATIPHQIVLGMLNKEAKMAFMTGTEEGLNQVYESGISLPLLKRSGNSMADIRLSY